jgi:4-hydroxy 2-oxovalerate aldolase
MAGMGRGAGNTATEDLVAELQNLELIELSDGALNRLDQFLNKNMKDLKQKHGWGPSLTYRLASYWGIHPTYVQELESEPTGEREVIGVLERLRDAGASKFISDFRTQTNEASTDTKHLQFRLTDYFKSHNRQDALIVGFGDSSSQHKAQIERFAQQNNCTILLLNNIWPEVLIDEHVFRVLSKRVEELGATDEFWRLPGRKIFSEEPRYSHDNYGPISIAPFLVREGEIGFTKKQLITPNDLTLSYALAVALYLEANNIYLAGIDGHKAGDPRNSDIRDTFQIMHTSHPSVTLKSLTATSFSIPIESPYWSGNL